MSSQKNKGSHAEKNKMVTGTIMTLAGGILWGVSGVCGQYMFQNKGVTAPWLVSVRLVAAGLLMLCYYFFTDKEQTLKIWKSKRDRRDVIIYGLLGMMPCQYAYFQTIEWSNAGTATVIQYLGPALIVVWVCFRTRRMPTVPGSYRCHSGIREFFSCDPWEPDNSCTFRTRTAYGTCLCGSSSTLHTGTCKTSEKI